MPMTPPRRAISAMVSSRRCRWFVPPSRARALLWLATTRMPDDLPLFAYSIFMAVFIVYCHRSNIDRMLKGTENRNPRVMLFKPRSDHGST